MAAVVVMVMAVLSSRYQLAAAVRATHPADALRSINLQLAPPAAGGCWWSTANRLPANSTNLKQQTEQSPASWQVLAAKVMGQFVKEVIAILILRAEKRSAANSCTSLMQYQGGI